jgi:hypothetical protein
MIISGGEGGNLEVRKVHLLVKLEWIRVNTQFISPSFLLYKQAHHIKIVYSLFAHHMTR